jgi:hypothetical protein
MTRLEKEFDAYFKSKGGISRDMFSKAPLVQNLLLYARAEVAFLRSCLKNIPPIYVDLVDKHDFEGYRKSSLGRSPTKNT